MLVQIFYNFGTILKVINKVKKVKLKKIVKEIVIIDDFSTDNTRKKLFELKDKNIRIFFHKKNRGKEHSRGLI